MLEQLRRGGRRRPPALAGALTASPSRRSRRSSPLCPAKFQDLPARSSASPHRLRPRYATRPPARPAPARRRAVHTHPPPPPAGRSDFLLGLTKAFFKSGKLAFVDSLLAGKKTLDAAFFKKMGRLLALWRFRRGVSAVRCLLYLNAKMRRLRALWKFRRSATVAAMVGRSWIRRAKEIHFGKAIERMQACGRGQVARLKARKMRAAKLVLQAGGRGFLGRGGRRVQKERAAEIARKKKEERERKIRERKEAIAKSATPRSPPPTPPRRTACSRRRRSTAAAAAASRAARRRRRWRDRGQLVRGGHRAPSPPPSARRRRRAAGGCGRSATAR